jgi:hypothetical protein
MSIKKVMTFTLLLAGLTLWLPRVSAQIVSDNEKHDLSVPLRVIPALPSTAKSPSVVKIGRIRRTGPNGMVSDSVLQSAPGPAVTTSTGFNFDGIANSDNVSIDKVSVAPPDPNGAVGLTQYVQWVNTMFAVYNKSTGALVYGPVAGSTLWSGFGGPCETQNEGDPIVQYDKIAHRWVLSQFANQTSSTGPYYECIAVSQTEDATGAWYRYSFTYNTNVNDYPKMGVWPDAYYFTYNMFPGNNPNGPFQGADVCAMDRTAMLSGAAATQVCFTLNASYGGVLPSDMDGSTPPATGTPDFLIGYQAPTTLNLWKFHVDFTTPANSTLSGPTAITVSSFNEACTTDSNGNCTDTNIVPQPSTTTKLDSLGDRPMYRLAYRNFGDHESLVFDHSVLTNGQVAVRWYELRNPNATPTVYQQSTYAPDTDNRWMGSVAMDAQGNMALGYSVSSSATYPSIRYTGRLAGDTPNTMEAENIVLAGTASQTGTVAGSSRWGDYTSMALDPSDDCTFWYTNEYIPTNGNFNWKTRIASFRFPSCGAAVLSSPSPGSKLIDSTVTFTWAAASNASGYALWIGTTPGGNDIVNTNLPIDATSYTANNLPITGAAIYVRLYSVINGANQYNDYTYTQASGIRAAITSPTNGTQLPGTSALFQWSAGTNVTSYQLYVGTTPGGSDVYNQWLGTALSATVTALPNDGNPVYVRLWSNISGSWLYRDYSYVAAGTPLAAMTSPLSGSQFPGTSVTFQWSAGIGISSYQLYVGSTLGGSNYYNQWLGKNQSTAVTGLPTDGSTVYVRLWSYYSGTWQYRDYAYIASGGPPTAAMTSPIPGTQLPGTSATFQWSSGTGVTYYQLYIGTRLGGTDVYNQWLGTNRSVTVTSLPTNGSPLYIRLWSYVSGLWQYRDYTYVAAGTPLAAMISPGPGTQLPGTSTSFQWSAGIGAVSYQLYVGTTSGGSDLYNQWMSKNLSATVTGLPSNGSTVYVRLWSYLGSWQYRDYTYIASGGTPTPAAMISPANGTQLSGTSVTFQWTAGIGASNYMLQIGSAPGGTNYYNQASGGSLAAVVSTLPNDGSVVYVRLSSYISGVWQYNDYTYTASGNASAAITSPTPGTQLPGTSATFQWTAGTGVSYYQLYVGTTPGGSDIYNQWLGTNRSTMVNTLPTGGGTVYVRLWSYMSGTWVYRNYTYTAAP